ncbi:MAG: hypothetical protein CL471_12035 [Acidobacteria bacterium]|nr:hypothetical protein [Acidobacteriota bacterium]
MYAIFRNKTIITALILAVVLVKHQVTVMLSISKVIYNHEFLHIFSKWMFPRDINIVMIYYQPVRLDLII